ncbi:MAG: hypothetical protein ACM30H_02540 [Clostridia bacterium]
MEGLRIEGKRAIYRLSGMHLPDYAADCVTQALEMCRVQGARELVADLGDVTPSEPVGLGSRAFYIREWHRASNGNVRLAVVVKPELIDPKKFGETFAQSIGMQARAFVTVAEAVEWLDSLAG